MLKGVSVDALVNIGADGDVFDLVENSRYTGSKADRKNHSKADYFDYFVKTVQINNTVFDVRADVQKQYGKNGGYVYTIKLTENKSVKASPIREGQKASLENSGNALTDETRIPQTGTDVNTSISEKGVKYSDRDSKGRKLSAEQLEYFKNSKVRDKNGNLLVVYHGTPESFTVFRNRGSGMYFTADPDYAYGYTQLRGKVMEQYINITKPFDILNDEDAKNIFVNEFIKGGYAQGINPSSSVKQIDEYIKNGVDWVEGDNLIEFLEENEYDYDGLILNEGSDSVTTQNGAQVNWRGFSYVIFEPNQTKNVDNLNPTKDNDIRYSDRYWYPDISHQDLSFVRTIAKNELVKTDNYIDNNTKWLYNKRNKSYFAIYSTENTEEPTILYACKDNRAKKRI